jgi:predicted site-specific integrase-resolvase
MNGYVRSEEIAERWDISVRQVQILCKAGKIEGAIKFGNTYAIPESAVKPTRTGKLKPGRKPKTHEVE